MTASDPGPRGHEVRDPLTQDAAAELSTAPEVAADGSEVPHGSVGAGSGERADLLEALRTQRYLFLHTVDGLTDAQAAFLRLCSPGRASSAASATSLG